jgi:hypothetical protein
MPLQVKLSIAKNEGGAGQDGDAALDPRMVKSLANLDLENADEDTQLYNMNVESGGKYSRKANWEDLNRYTGMEVTPDVLRDWIVNYQKRCFPEGKCVVCLARCRLQYHRILIQSLACRLGKGESHSQEMLHQG